MSNFEKLIEGIKSYNNVKGNEKATAHHSAVAVRVEEMEKALGKKENNK